MPLKKELIKELTEANIKIENLKKIILERDMKLHLYNNYLKDLNIFSWYGRKVVLSVLNKLARRNFISRSMAFKIYMALGEEAKAIKNATLCGIDRELERYKEEIKK